MHSSEEIPRRGFLGRLAAGLTLANATLAALPRRLGAEAGPSSGPPDETWMRNLTGKHRIVFDVATHNNGRALTQAKNVLDVYEGQYGVPTRDINLVLGAHGTALPLVLADAVWQKYRLGEQYAINDPATQGASTRNVYTAANVQTRGPVTAEQTVEALQRRGVLFLACNNTVINTSRRLATAGLGTEDAIRQDLAGGLLAGVVLVPDLFITIWRMQERGIAYLHVG
jgi:intracellular sulfur oxidation DsrE/DsrF family protein